jgi:quercetin dioxygenase-like cupin family protein
VEEHTETKDSGSHHEEIYFVAKGRATFTVEDEEVEAPEGTFVYIRDPGVTRSAVAHAPDTIVLAVGGTPGEAFAVSPWESKYDRPAAR